MPNTRPKLANGPGCLMLFALPFIAFGAGMGGCAGWTAVKVRDSQHWKEVPAVIKSAELKRGDTLRALALDLARRTIDSWDKPSPAKAKKGAADPAAGAVARKPASGRSRSKPKSA